MLFVVIIYVALMLTGVARGELEWKGFLFFLLTALISLGLILGFKLPLVWFTVVLVALNILLIIFVFKGNPDWF